MRRIFFATLASFAFAQSAAADPPNAQTAFVERQGLIEVDRRCRLLPVQTRTALQAGAAQARGALLRAGWTGPRMRQLEAAVRDAAASRACGDARTREAVEEARGAYAAWATASVMEFPGWERAWIARRTVGPNGWRLSQSIDAPIAATFGVREFGGAQGLSFIVSGANNAEARLITRDAARAAMTDLDLTGRMAFGLEAGAPSLGAPTRTFAATRRAERIVGRSQTVYTFADEAFAALLALDPRESAVLQIGAGRNVQTFYVEVGDVAAARSFLALRAD